MHHEISHDMQACIEACQMCHTACLSEATQHCLQAGGTHTEPTHYTLMLACAEICQTSANFMLMGSPFHPALCGVCAQVCEACAKSCEQIGDMQSCVEACRHCAESCRQMAGQGQTAAASAMRH